MGFSDGKLTQSKMSASGPRIILKAHIISLSNASERRAFQQEQLSRLGIKYCVVDAVSTADLSEIKSSILLNCWERPLMPTEVACFFSHYKIWQKIADGNEPALILEDDALLSSDVPNFLCQIQKFDGLEHLSLEVRQRKKLIGSIRQVGVQLGFSRLYQDRTGAAAYILWPSGAKKLVNHACTHGAALADALISNHVGLSSWQATPALAIQSDMAERYSIFCPLKTHSYIQANDSRANYKAVGRQSLYYKARRIMGQLRLAKQYLTHFMHATRQHVPINTDTFTGLSSNEKTPEYPA